MTTRLPTDSIQPMNIDDNSSRFISPSNNTDADMMSFIEPILVPSSDNKNILELILKSMPKEELLLYYSFFSHYDIFNSTNMQRISLINEIEELELSFDSLGKILKQIKYLMPYRTTDGINLLAITGILTNMSDEMRDFFIRIANQFFDWDMENYHRVIICNGLSDLNLDELNKKNSLSVKEKIEYAQSLIKTEEEKEKEPTLNTFQKV